MIIGIAGTLGAGKGTVVEYLKEKGFGHYSSSGTLIKILKERGDVVDREHMSSLANELQANYEGGIANFSHQYAKAAGDEHYIIEALHRVSEGEYVKKIGGVILGVDADIDTRYARISKRGDSDKDNVSFEQFQEDSRREDEGATGTGPNIRAVIEMADHTIMNEGTLEELHEQIDAWLQAHFN